MSSPSVPKSSFVVYPGVNIPTGPDTPRRDNTFWSVNPAGPSQELSSSLSSAGKLSEVVSPLPLGHFMSREPRILEACSAGTLQTTQKPSLNAGRFKARHSSRSDGGTQYTPKRMTETPQNAWHGGSLIRSLKLLGQQEMIRQTRKDKKHHTFSNNHHP